MQTPADRTDNEPNTSDGIMVYTNFRPSLLIGDLVTVQGIVQEVDGQTRFSSINLSFSTVGQGQPSPPAIKIDGNFPLGLAQDVPELEQLEGMLVEIEGITTGPSNGIDMVPVRGGTSRAFREPGIPYPGLADLPIWDGNPEIFYLDPDALNAPNDRFITGGTVITATAIIAQREEEYRALPLQYSTSGGTDIRAVRPKKEGEISIASLNVLNLFESNPDYLGRIRKFGLYIKESLQQPDIIAMQEVGSFQVLRDLSDEIVQLPGGVDYKAYMAASSGGIKLGFLVHRDLTDVTITELGENERFGNGSILHDRPPVVLETNINGKILRILNVHLRSRNGIEGGDNFNFVRTKRYEQALSVSRMAENLRDEDLILIGDFNAFEFTDGYVDVINQIRGSSSLGALFPLQQIVSPTLQNLTEDLLPPSERYSFVFQGNAEMLDHCLANELQNFKVVNLAFARGNSDQPESLAGNNQIPNRVSDHDGFVVYLEVNNTVSNEIIQALRTNLSFPNPISAGQRITLEQEDFERVEIFLLDAMGRLVLQKQFGEPNVYLNWPETLLPGVYFMQIQTKDGMITKKIVGD